MSEKIQQFFPPSLFWDININEINIETHRRFIVERVVARGDRKDWENLLQLYGEKGVLSAALTIRSLDPKSLNFLCFYFNTGKDKFRCCS